MKLNILVDTLIFENGLKVHEILIQFLKTK